ncbi:MAG: membrane dipeptidase, partial [Metallosphaera sp.]
VDLAHAGKRTVMDVASITRKPVIVSHGNVMKLKTHRRNLDDEEIEAVVRTKGVIGVTAIVSTLREPTLQGLVENLRYIGESYGWEYVSLGTDFLGIEKTPEGFDNVMKVNDLLKYVEGHEEEVLWKNAMRVIMANMV